MQRLWKTAVGLSLCACLLAGCGGAPAAEAEKDPQPAATKQMGSAEDRPEENVFLSTDGSMEYTMDLQVIPQDGQLDPRPITPYFLTGEDVKALCLSLLGEGAYYEQEPSVGGKYSKAELEEAAEVLQTYLDREAMEEMAGAGSPLVGMISDYQNLLEGTRKRIPQGTEENPHQPCDWTYKAFNHYKNSDWDAKTDDLALMAQAERNGIRYTISAINREDMPYLSSLYIEYGTEMPEYQLMRAVYHSRFCRTAPTEDQVREAQQKAMDVMDGFQPGKWDIEFARVQEEPHGEFSDYSIQIRCAPILGGTPGLTDFYQDLPRKDTRIYPPAQAEFRFAPNGELLQFFLGSLFLEAAEGRSQTELLPVQELLEIGREQLKKYTAYDNPAADLQQVYHWEQQAGESLVGKVLVHTARLCLARYETETGKFQYMPVLTIQGHTEFRGQDSGKLYFTSDQQGYERSQLVVISAVDGRVISN